MNFWVFLLAIFLTSFLTCLWDWRDLWTCNYDNFFPFFFLFLLKCAKQTVLALGNILPHSIWTIWTQRQLPKMGTRLTSCHNPGFVFKWNTHILAKRWEKWGSDLLVWTIKLWNKRRDTRTSMDWQMGLW